MALNTLYNNLNLPSGLAGERKLFQLAKALDSRITLAKVKAYLKTQPSYTLHKINRRVFSRRRILVAKPGVILSIDLGDMTKLARYNKGYKYMLVAIDSFSRYLKVSLLKRKNAESVFQALKPILESPEFQHITRIHSDHGTEFYNKRLLSYLKSRNITLYSVSSYDIKSSIAERVIQTIKRKLYKYLTHKNTMKYYDVLPIIVEAYNNTIHSTLGKTPSEVHGYKTPKEIRRQFNYIYKKERRAKKSLSTKALVVGTTVRLSRRHDIFSRGFYLQNTNELFKITEVDHSQLPIVYRIQDLGGEPIQGIFYKEELIPSSIPEYFHVDVLKKKKIRNKLWYYVSWRGYPSKFDTWIEASALKK